MKVVEDGQVKKYFVHHRLLWSVVNKRSNAFNWTNGTGQLDTTGFEDKVRPPTYRLFLHWLYHNEFTGPDNEDDLDYPQLLELYFLAVSWGITILQNVMIDSLISKVILEKKQVPSGWCKKIYHATSPGDQLRRLWVDFYAWDMNKDSFVDEKIEDLDPCFLKDLAVVQMELFLLMTSATWPGRTKPTLWDIIRPTQPRDNAAVESSLKGLNTHTEVSSTL